MDSQRKIIGVVGGLGPFAHIEFERRLLAAVPDAGRDQDYPSWILSSIPTTPDRTAALLGQGPSPVPYLRESLHRIAPVADLAVIPCNTAHVFLDDLLHDAPVPIMSMVDETIYVLLDAVGPDACVGLMGTTGMLTARVYQDRARDIAPNLRWLTLLDLPDGAHLQAELVMRPIYGVVEDGRDRRVGGLKAGSAIDPISGAPHGRRLLRAAQMLSAAGAVCVVTACTEIALATGRGERDGLLLIDPLDVLARAAVRCAVDTRPMDALIGRRCARSGWSAAPTGPLGAQPATAVAPGCVP